MPNITATTRSVTSLLVPLAIAMLAGVSSAQNFIPGNGQKVKSSGDNFEDEKWSFTHRFPKSSYNLDKQSRDPLGISNNGLWHESGKRGQPDVVKRVATPKGGLPGSKGALLMRTLNSGVPRYLSRGSQQDDLLFNDPQLGTIPISYAPNVIVRVFMPPFDQWEDRTDTSFGFRLALDATTFKIKRGFFRKKRIPKREMFYPGMFIQFNSPKDSGEQEKSAVFIIRRNSNGEDVLGPKITKTGWWTLGMSITPDSRVHYFAKPGIEKLTRKDLVFSSSYGGTRFENYHTFFFDIISKNDGRTWSTPWIIDDPQMHYGNVAVQAGRGVERR